jgi:phosphate transport system substrate-binding protein
MLLFLLLITACASAPTPPPTPQIARILTTPAFEGTIADWAAIFTETQESVLIEIDTLAPQAAIDAVTAGKADLVVAGVNPPPGWFASPLWVEGIAVVVHLSNSVRRLSTDDLREIFTGRVTSWGEFNGDNRDIQPIVPIPGDDVRSQFESQVLRATQFTPNSLLAPNPSVMISMVMEDKGAIGILPLSLVTDEVLDVILDDIIPTESNVQKGLYPLRIEILALAPDEPAGVAREWLAWVQSMLQSGAP